MLASKFPRVTVALTRGVSLAPVAPLLHQFPMTTNRSTTLPVRSLLNLPTTAITQTPMLGVKPFKDRISYPPLASTEARIIIFIQAWIQLKVDNQAFFELKQRISHERDFIMSMELKNILTKENEAVFMNRLGVLLRGGNFRYVDLANNNISFRGALAFADGLAADFRCDHLNLQNNNIGLTPGQDHEKMALAYKRLRIDGINLTGNKFDATSHQIWEKYFPARPSVYVNHDPASKPVIDLQTGEVVMGKGARKNRY
jgi:hypothetical protein